MGLLMYILRWVYNTPAIAEFHNRPQMLMQSLYVNAKDAYLKRRNDHRYQNLRVYQYRNGEEIDITETIK